MDVQILKTSTLKKIVSFRICERRDVLSTTMTFKYVNKYKNILSKVQSAIDFMFNLPLEVLYYAASLGPMEPHSAKQDRKSEMGSEKQKN